MSRVDVSVKVSHNVAMLQSAEEGDFKSSGAGTDQSLGELLFEADVFVRLPAHEGDPGVGQSLIGASEGLERGIEFGERLRGDAMGRGHFFRVNDEKLVGFGIELLAMAKVEAETE